MSRAAATDLPPPPPADGYLPSRHAVACAVHDPAPGRCDCGATTRRPAYSLATTQAYARAAIAACEGPDSYEALWNALQRIDTAAAALAGYEVRHEGGIEDFTRNIVEAICHAATPPVAQERPESSDAVHLRALVLLGNAMASQLKKSRPDSAWPAKWGEYLAKHGLSSPLRAAAAPGPQPELLWCPSCAEGTIRGLCRARGQPLECQAAPASTADPAQPVDDAQVMHLWRQAGLPEYFLGNGGTNVRLCRFADLVRASTARPTQSGEAPCPSAE